MQADNSRHVIAAARRRAAATRKRAVAALRHMDKAGLPITFDSVAKQAGSPGPGSTTSRTCEPRSNASAPDRPHPRHSGLFPTGNAPLTPRCCGDWSPRPSASGGWRNRTRSSANHSPWPSESAERTTSSATSATRRGTNPPRSSAPADSRVDDTVLIGSLLVKAMIISPAQDNDR